MVVLDDCQWADELMIRLIAHWQASLDDSSVKRHVLLVVAFRSEEVAEDHAFRRIHPAAHLRLALFDPGDLRRLAERSGPGAAD